MRKALELKITNKGQNALSKLSNNDILELFDRKLKTLNKNRNHQFFISHERNHSILIEGEIFLFSDNDMDFEEGEYRNASISQLGKLLKDPFIKLFDGENLDNIISSEFIEINLE